MNKGIVYGILCYLMWGLLPLYWRLFESMSAWEILAHRVLWSFVFVAVLAAAAKRWRNMLSVVSSRNSLISVLLCSVTISLNWVLFIWAVNHEHVIETSLGYYMNPLISVLFAVIFLKEKLSRGQWISILIAACGVLLMALQFGGIPWIALSLAVSFALYGLAKKMANLDVLLGLLWETLIVLPLAIMYLGYMQAGGSGTFFTLTPFSMTMLLLSGAATALPLFLFASAAKLLPLSMVGFIQYVAPTTSLLLAVFVFHESFTAGKLVSFSLIWLALILYSAVTFRSSKLARREKKAA
ncbi:EamA family transporter RarD [Paenibacillus mucilaginosus]|uniref:EamA domain-containing protein n=2 Tax=Paenibacillus mucilaginosus TaxID=61624 RepID=H6NI39_9BACL|nr:EamA family transporter RarD [Paenibacillus mucilaginosus]AEI43143.1 hypothetical protein KNP414_04613 [Paenibacillus mucilaginosus KNP414]AFC30810.1 hypothetical protein PM3016_4026 [Paenibacillus mucilaginosus 3016]MCG7212290.1 EamA family transporter RarD [Paenibacillus mucilaginosus]WDM24749.1 EamA family transporter RarD [Paenibacillus mucilaginosus]WFA19416.1 EamA family transporter RarD [Paenibacillus mucilaginosus]